ncbi:MAG TPA: glycerol-3-phosphate dehydrogenase/oxidase [Acidothermaceae bacterium]|nr:glycerol-3-phosphate dehydrogenase/oxidase [Acidothermaceae bacterium]
MSSAQLGPRYREAVLQEMSETEFDLLVIGGGIVGAGSALDAVSRGLTVALVEAHDWAAGTSSRSSKLIHGGLRYLEQRNFTLVREALKERGLLLNRIAPHLVRPVPFLLPLQHRIWERFYIGTGVFLYDRMGGARAVPGHRHLSRQTALRIAPGLRSDALIGAIQYYDAQMDDARYVTTVVRTAAHHGAKVARGTRVVGFLREGEQIVGARMHDVETDKKFVIRAKQIINATGVWTDDTQEMVGGRGRFHVRASKGVHLVVPRNRIQLDTGLILRTEKSVLFVIPWGRHWIIGTTDTDWELDKVHPAASSTDIAYILDHVNAVLRAPLTPDDVEGVYAGLRPLLAGESEQTSKLSREHSVEQPVPGLTVIAGGKYTTYRVMAKDAVDVARRGMNAGVPDSVTERLALLGADGYEVLWNERQRLAASSGLHVARIEHLLHRYGSCIRDLLDLIAEDPTLGEPVSATSDYLRAEIVYATSHEGALHLDDVLTRRTRISIEEWDRGTGSARDVALLMASVLGWDDKTINSEVEHYQLRVEAERASQRQPDDQTADAARLGAPDIVPLRGDPREGEAASEQEDVGRMGTVSAIRPAEAEAN